jgi:glutathione peroxidase
MSFYDLKFNDSRGKSIEMEQFKGKVIIIVNTATKCGLAPQFEELEGLYQKYKDKNLIVIGFPCGQFANQEPETNETMTQTCKINFGVTFPLSEKIFVNGDESHPVFTFLKENTKSGLLGRKIKWNFTKFIVSSEGIPMKRYAPTVKPSKMEKDIIALLTQDPL